jgi:cyclophilin family peptidyl-prolyl cis-trans isomerase
MRRAPPPLRLALAIVGVGEIALEVDAAAEPEVAARIAELVDVGAYAKGKIRKTADRVEIGLLWPALPRRVSPRRTKHSRFDRGSIGWAWSKTPGDGDGRLFIVFDRQPGLDAVYQEIGRVVAGLELLEAMPRVSERVIRGRPTIGPATIETVRRLVVV